LKESYEGQQVSISFQSYGDGGWSCFYGLEFIPLQGVHGRQRLVHSCGVIINTSIK
jgi:hypothetical protein